MRSEFESTAVYNVYHIVMFYRNELALLQVKRDACSIKQENFGGNMLNVFVWCS